MDPSLYLMFGRARSLVLYELYRESGRASPLYLRELARRTGLSPTAVQYELRLLRQAGIIDDIGTASRPLYTASREHPLFRQMRALFSNVDDKVIVDDAHFRRKRVRQKEDLSALSADSNSPFLRERDSIRRNVKLSRRG